MSKRRSQKTETPVTIIQSVPEGTNLAIAGVESTKDAWVRLIDNSRETIDIEQMYVDGKEGQALEPVIAALKRAATERKVKVRFILSKNMIDTNKATLEQIKAVPGLELRVIDIGKITGGIQHSKYWIFDGKTICVGSNNTDWKSLTQIVETGVVIESTRMAAQLKSIFDLDFEVAKTGKPPEVMPEALENESDADVYLVASPPKMSPKNIKGSFDELTSLLKNAHTSVRITLLDMSTYLFGAPGEWKDLDNLLRETAGRGVKVQILVSHWNTEKPEVTTIKELSKVKNIEVKISTIPDLATGHVPYSRVNHSKFMVVDDSLLWVGTSNWSKGYFMDTRGIEIVMKRPELAKIALESFIRLWNEPYTEFVDVTKDYPKPIK
ncbi:MAG: hypothetical protein JST80_06700 [Bdellovibrionales bacterium]|nr:hypothetical protein [Bdellovibrionales bacterium]